ncbi:MAG TPA: VCBS repeat-containing protein [Pyrinomonadaceae bacterium]|nr:VCBS repeat-containing protein [Pyrinomonadaceae bacterium]
MKKYFCLLIALGCIGMLSAANASAQVLLNELDINPSGTDNPCEYVELIGPPGTVLNNLYFLSLEGDSNKGQVTAVLQFGDGTNPGPSLGSNGLLVVTSPTTCGTRSFPAGTTAVTTTLLDAAGGALQNGTNSFLLVSSPTAIAATTDLDTNDDGTLDALPVGATIVDGVSWSDGGAGDITYGTVLTAAGGTIGAATRFPGNTTPNSASAWYAGAMTGANSDNTYSATIRTANFPPDGALTPGAPNVGTPVKDAPVDMNGDGKTDWVVVRNTNNQYTWYTFINGGNPQPTVDWGMSTGVQATSDLITSGDFDGDLKDDIVVYRPTNGTFYILQSQTSTVRLDQLGTAGDNPTVVADYNGDGKDDVAVYRSSTGQWFYRTAPDAFFNTVQWGQVGDFPAPGDYDGDGKSDFVVQRDQGGQGAFYKNLTTAGLSIETFGLSTDFIVPGDYDGDGKTDIATARGENGSVVWRFEPSGTAGSTVVQDTWGLTASDIPAQGDYDGDGKTDYGVWRSTTGTFYVMTVGTHKKTIQPWGQTNDGPVASYNVH